MHQGYSIRDDKALLFSPPFFVKNVVLALRSVLEAAQDPGTQLAKFPNDFSLYRICDYDEDSGEIHNANPVHIATIQSVLEKKGNQNEKSNA